MLDPTGLRSDSTGNGMGNPGTGTDVNDDDWPLGANGRNLRNDPLLNAINRLAKLGQALGNIAASFNPLANATTILSKQNPDGSCATIGDRIGAGLALAGEGLGALSEWGVDMLRLLRKGCFVAGTPVQMADGTTKPIEQVQVGDLVCHRDRWSGGIRHD